MSVTPETSGRTDPTPATMPSGLVELVFPVASDLLLLARLVVSSVAARSGFDIEEIEDLRLAVDELCLAELRGRRSGRVVLQVDGSADQIEVWCHHAGAVGPVDDDGDTDGLSDRILDALVDEHGRVTRDGRAGARMYKRRARRDG